MMQKQAILIPGRETFIEIKPTIFETDERLKNESYEFRQCYFDDEMKLSLFEKYSQDNCIIECAINFTITRFNDSCIPWYLPSK